MFVKYVLRDLSHLMGPDGVASAIVGSQISPFGLLRKKTWLPSLAASKWANWTRRVIYLLQELFLH